MRTFLAFDIAEDLREEINQIIWRYKNYKNIKWVEKDNLHITTHFIGDTRYEDLTDLDEIFSELFEKLPKFNILNSEINIIPAKKPRIIWVGIKPENELVFHYIKKMRKRLSIMHYKPDKNSLKLHITLGRIKGRLDKSFFPQMLSEKIYNIPSLIEKITFYESILKPNGPEYYPLKTYKLQSTNYLSLEMMEK
jgi:RNA 2',3'-cyclic 3'-phosphodiesterase